MKRMKTRRELNALAMTNVSLRRTSSSGSRQSNSITKSNKQYSSTVSESTETEEKDEDKGKNNKCAYRRTYQSSFVNKPRNEDFSAKYRTQLNFCAVTVIIECVAASLLMLWIFQDMKEQAGFLQDNVQEVVAGNQGVPDALHLCHTVSKQLEKNQTEIYALVTQLSTQLLSVTNQLTVIGKDLAAVQDRMRLTPELVNIPNDVKTLTTSVTSFGSDIKDLKNTVKRITDAEGNINVALKLLASNFTEINDRMDLLESGSLVNNNGNNGNNGNNTYTYLDVVKNNDDYDNNTSCNNISLSCAIKQLAANLTFINATTWNEFELIERDKHNQQKILENLVEKSDSLTDKFGNVTSELNQVKAENSILSMVVQNLTMQFQSSVERYKTHKR